ncbi:MAG TPA: hypothetical protein PK765_02505 [bacterium]|nr:hypothetical protein [bacterium]
MRSFREIGLIGGDILRLYRHFFDWNLKKLFFLFYFAAGAVVLSIPFVVTVALIGYANPDLVANLTAAVAGVNAGRPVDELIQTVANTALPVAGIALAIGGILTIFLIASMYAVVLLSRVYLGYIDDRKISIPSLPLWSWHGIKQVIGALSWQGVRLLGLLVIAGILLVVARIVLGSDATLVYGISGVIFAVIFVYVIVRMSFVFGSLGEESGTGGWQLARENWTLFRGPTGLLAIATCAPYLLGLVMLTALFDQTAFGSTFAGSIFWFFVFDSVEMMVFISIYARVREGKFFRNSNP